MYEQDRVLSRLQQYVLRDAAIRVCFISGSYGRRTNDPYSDLDVALVYADEPTRELAYRDRRTLVQAVMPYVPAKSFDADHIRPYFHIALYSNGAKVDYRFETQSELQPNARDREIRILKDSAGWGEQLQAQAPHTTAAVPILKGAEMADLDNRFWVMAWDVFRLLRRGDHTKPFPIYLDLLHTTLPPLLTMLPPEDAAHQALINIRFDHDTAVSSNHLRQLIDAYVAARSAVIKRHHIPFTTADSFERGIRALAQR